MRSTKVTVAIAAALCLTAGKTMAQTTLNFEGLGSGYQYPIPDGYGGFQWGTTSDPGWWATITSPPFGSWVDPTICVHDGGNTCAFNDGPVGGGPVSLSRTTPFNFMSLWLANYQGAGSLTITGWLAGSEVYSDVVTLGSSFTNYAFDWTNVDMVNIDPGAANSAWFLADNLTYSDVTPEPVTMVLLGTGLFGIGMARIRRRRNGTTEA